MPCTGIHLCSGCNNEGMVCSPSLIVMYFSYKSRGIPAPLLTSDGTAEMVMPKQLQRLFSASDKLLPIQIFGRPPARALQPACSNRTETDVFSFSSPVIATRCASTTAVGPRNGCFSSKMVSSSQGRKRQGTISHHPQGQQRRINTIKICAPLGTGVI